MNIWEFISEEEVFSYYLYPVSFSKKFTNPFRKDRNPGCNYKRLGDRLFFVDFGSQKKHYTATDIVMLRYQCSFKEAIQRIDLDFNLGLYFNFNAFSNCTNITNKINKEVTPIPKCKPHTKDIIVEIQKVFCKDALKFWKQFGITDEILIKYNIKQLKKVFINNRLVLINDLIFGYYNKNGLFKIYCPFRKTSNFKFISIKQVLENFDNIDFNKKSIIITKSFKDSIIYNLIGYNAIAPPSESSLELIESNKEILNKFNCYVQFDKDTTGIEGTQTLLNLYPNFKQITYDFNEKDISDFVKNNDLLTLKKYINDRYPNI